jgi:hypothetical protein
MTYTATVFSAPVRVLFHAVFSPEIAREEQRQGAFLTARTHREVRVHIVDRLFIHPAVAAVQRTADRLAELHHGKVTAYAAYVLAALAIVVLVVRILYFP